MRGRLGKATMVPDDFRSTDAVRFPASLDGLRKHFLDIARELGLEYGPVNYFMMCDPKYANDLGEVVQ